MSEEAEEWKNRYNTTQRSHEKAYDEISRLTQLSAIHEQQKKIDKDAKQLNDNIFHFGMGNIHCGTNKVIASIVLLPSKDRRRTGRGGDRTLDRFKQMFYTNV